MPAAPVSPAMSRKPTVLALAALALLAACPPAQPPQPPPSEPAPPPVVITQEHSLVPALGPETWVGTVTLLGASLAVIARLEPDPDKPGTWRGRLDIPMQGIKDFPLQDVDLDAEGLEFTLAPPGASEAQRAVFVASREPDAGTAQGELSQHGQRFPLELRQHVAELRERALRRVEQRLELQPTVREL